uniref:Clathrin light chain n=1 Tax=Haptolina ericina TaxID=156174 RepID=A0A7S3AE98_9EUKA
MENKAAGEKSRRDAVRAEMEEVERKMEEMEEDIKRKLAKVAEFKEGRAKEVEAEAYREALAAFAPRPSANNLQVGASAEDEERAGDARLLQKLKHALRATSRDDGLR